MGNNIVAMNEFATRHTADSPYSHFEGSFDELVDMVSYHLFIHQENGFKEGVLLVNVPPDKFRCGVIELTPETELFAVLKPRREEEAPYVHLTARGQKAQAVKVQVIVYRADVLAESNENSTDAAWEIVSINTSTTSEDPPMPPITMARNFLGLVGGTKGDFSAEDFAAAIIYWSDKAMVHPEES